MAARDFGQAEVQNFGVAPVSHENVRRLDVAVHDALSMGGFEGIGHFNAKPQQFFELHRSLTNHVLQRLPCKAFHDDEEPVLVLANLVDGANVGMIQSRGGARFAAEAFQCLSILRSFFGEKLQGNEAAEGGVLSLVHDAHATATE